MFVQQHAQAETGKCRQPRLVFGVILVVAGNGKNALAGLQIPQGGHVIGPFLRRPVYQIARHQDEIRIQGIGFFNHGLDPGRLIEPADMQIGELHQPESIQFRRQARQKNLHRPDIWHTNGLPHPNGRKNQRAAQQNAGCAGRRKRKSNTHPGLAQAPQHDGGHILEEQKCRQQHVRPKQPPQRHQHGKRHFGRRQRAKKGAADEVMLRNQHNDQGQQPFWDRFDGQGPYKPPQHVNADDAGKQVDDQQIGFTFFLIATANAGSKRRAEWGTQASCRTNDRQLSTTLQRPSTHRRPVQMVAVRARGFLVLAVPATSSGALSCWYSPNR